MDSNASSDPRAKYRTLPAAVQISDTVESVDGSSELADDLDANVGAKPYMQIIMGSWVR